MALLICKLQLPAIHASRAGFRRLSSQVSQRSNTILHDRTLYLSNIDPSVGEDELGEFLSVAGSVQSLSVVRQHGQSVGMA